MFIRGGSIVTTDALIVINNTAKSSVLLMIDCRAHFSGNIQFKSNSGSLYAYSSNVTLLGTTAFVNQQETNTDTTFGRNGMSVEVGGAITSIYSTFNFQGSVILSQNSAASG